MCILTSANSINIGRLVPQIVYYFESYKYLVNHGVIQIGDTSVILVFRQEILEMF